MVLCINVNIQWVLLQGALEDLNKQQTSPRVHIKKSAQLHIQTGADQSAHWKFILLRNKQVR